MLRTSLFLLLGIFLCTSARAQERNQLLIDSLHEEMTLLAATDQVPGFAVALVTADGPVYERGFGYADLATKRPYTPQTTQNIGSISKTFIGVSLLQAEQEGLLSLEDPINQYLPFQVTHPRYPNQPILLKHLANHTAGISDDKNYDYAYTLLEPATIARGEVSKGEYKEFRAVQQNEPYTLEAFLHRFFTPGGRFYHKKNFTKAAPGAVYKYSNVGAALAAYVLERATKTPFPEWTEQHLFQPLKMTNTAWRPDQVNDRMTHYFANRKPMPNYLLATYPDGGLWTSIHQLGLWCSAAIGGMEKGNDILSESAYNRLLENRVKIPGDDESYGIFWERMDSGFHGHSGGDPGITTLMYINEENGYGHLVFVSGTPKDDGFFMQALLPLIRYGRKMQQP